MSKMVSTPDLETGSIVTLDGEAYRVQQLQRMDDNPQDFGVTLCSPLPGSKPWLIECEDSDEPIWEVLASPERAAKWASALWLRTTLMPAGCTCTWVDAGDGVWVHAKLGKFCTVHA